MQLSLANKKFTKQLITLNKLYMKLFFFTFTFFCLYAGNLFAQSKIEFGLISEGNLFIPGNSSNYSTPKENGFGAGIGVYAAKGIFGKLSADIGLTYRFKQLREYYIDPFRTSGSYGGYEGGTLYDYKIEYSAEGKINGWKIYPLQYLVVPVHLQYQILKNIFVRGGIEACWLTNYDEGKDNPEFNWTLGIGSQYRNLKWSVNYIRGFKDVGFVNNLFTMDGMRSATAYRNNMLQLSLSYPLWQKK